MCKIIVYAFVLGPHKCRLGQPVGQPCFSASIINYLVFNNLTSVNTVNIDAMGYMFNNNKSTVGVTLDYTLLNKIFSPEL